MKRIVSVSLGSSKRNKTAELTLFGEPFRLERIGVDGDMARFRQTFLDLDAEVDAFGIGGADLYVVAGDRRYAFQQIAGCVAGLQKPVADGSGLKHTLEAESVRWLQDSGEIDFKQEKVVLMSAVDRHGMAQALAERCPDVLFGDLMFGLGLPIPVRSIRAVERLGKLLLPIITRLPLKWFYPTGEKQEQRKPMHAGLMKDRTFIAGDSLYILRYAPDNLTGKTVLTQSVRKRDREFFQNAGLSRLVLTTLEVEGESFATNVLEAALLALYGVRADQLTRPMILDAFERMNWKPQVIRLNPTETPSP